MGLKLFSDMPPCSGPLQPGNPNPKRFHIVRYSIRGEYITLLVHYPDCHTFEGRKLLVYRRVSLMELLHAKELDPHFRKDTPAPIARFLPTPEGEHLARIFVAAAIADPSA
jgi:hypothetical protein